MLSGNQILEEDLKNIIHAGYIPWRQLDGKIILVTGATGLIGFNLVSALLYYGKSTANPPRILAVVRNKEKAQAMFSDMDTNCLTLIAGDVTRMPDILSSVDFLIHGASQTSSQGFVSQPVETIDTAFYGTKNILELARQKNTKKVIFLSTMEVYGYPKKGHKVTENDIGALTPQQVRNCYPLSKILCENLCASYGHEYHVPINVLRLTQTFGPGVSYNDGRVFAEFARCVIEDRDIVLKTKGETERSYLYTADAVTAILTVLLKGENGETYHAANESTYCSIAEMAELVSKMNEKTIVQFELHNNAQTGFADTLYMDLDTTKLKRLGWDATTGLKDMYKRMIETIKEY